MTYFSIAYLQGTSSLHLLVSSKSQVIVVWVNASQVMKQSDYLPQWSLKSFVFNIETAAAWSQQVMAINYSNSTQLNSTQFYL